jgi:hypothetical protein
LLEKVIVPQPVTKFKELLRIQRIIIMFTRALPDPTLSQINSVQALPSYFFKNQFKIAPPIYAKVTLETINQLFLL